MRRSASLVALVIGCLCVALTALAQGFALIGHTTLTYPGDTGVLAMTQACQVDFGPAARMCSIDEVWRSSTPPPVGTEPAWVRMTPATHGSELSLSPSFTSKDCLGWAADWPKGLAVTPTGALQHLDCAVARPIACCIPVPEPSTSSGLVPGALLLCALQRWRVP